MSYRILFERPAEKAFRRLPKEIQQGFAGRLAVLAENPCSSDSRKLAGVEDCYRIRQGDYRLVYTILREAIVVLVLRVGHRGDVYRDLAAVAKTVRTRKTEG